MSFMSSMKMYRAYIVVLGCAVENDGTPSPWLEARIRKAMEVYSEIAISQGSEAAVVIMTGAAVSSRHVEADVMKSWVLNQQTHPSEPSYDEKLRVANAEVYMAARQLQPALTLPSEGSILTETTARDTPQNCFNSAKMIAKMHRAPCILQEAPTVYVITNEFHLPRATLLMRRSLRHFGLDCATCIGIGAEAPFLEGANRELRHTREKLLIVSDAAKLESICSTHGSVQSSTSS